MGINPAENGPPGPSLSPPVIPVTILFPNAIFHLRKSASDPLVCLMQREGLPPRSSFFEQVFSWPRSVALRWFGTSGAP